MPNRLSLPRRQFLRTAVGASFLVAVHRPAWGIVQSQPKFVANPFTLGVASGDPNPDGFVIWSRLAPEPLVGGGVHAGDIEVHWEVSEDESMRRILKSGTAVAKSDLAHSIHVEVSGLRPDRWYWYRFHAGDAVSPIGRARTTPTVEANELKLRFAFASCQHYEHGYYNALRAMSRDHLDLVFHLGDYIYEGAAAKGKTRQHVGGELNRLEDYRNRHAQYKTDADLQAAHQMCPWVVTWDDHEFDNNCAGDISEEKNVDSATFLARRANAYQAYYEHMPLRPSAMPRGPHMTLYRTISYGRLAEFQVLDTRQYRTDQPCGDGTKPPCDGVYDPKATLLGDVQEQWLGKQLQKSPATWNVFAQQIMMGRVDRAPGEVVAWSMDQWSGYDVARKRLLQNVQERKVRNPVVLTGDIHSNWVNDLKVDFDDAKSPIIATEFVGTSISSGGDGAEKAKSHDGVMSENPFVKFYNTERGYVRCEVTDKQWQADYLVTKVSTPDAECVTRASFVVENGRPGAEKA